MTAQIMEGRSAAAAVKESLKPRIEALASTGRPPHLAVVLVGDDGASVVYAQQKEKHCRSLGIDFSLHRLAGSSSQQEVLELVKGLSADGSVDGLMVEMPLPPGLQAQEIQGAIDPAKDVDGVTWANLGRLLGGRPGFIPCTAEAVLELLKAWKVDLAGRRAAVVGRSVTVGKTAALLLLEQHCTVTVCHSRTKDLAGVLRQSGIVVAAIGRPKFVTASMVAPGAVVVDVGINSTPEGLVGDCDFQGLLEKASMITPVPGGVGPLTNALMLRHLVEAAELQRKRA